MRQALLWMCAGLVLFACPAEQEEPVMCNIGGDPTGFTLVGEFTGRVDGKGGVSTGALRLIEAPVATVTVPLSAGEYAVLSPTSLTFTPDTWNTPQTVIVSATEAGMLALLSMGSTVPVFVGPTESDVEALRCKSDVLIGPSLPRCGDGVHDAVLGEACDPPVDKPFCAVGEATCLVCSRRCTLEPGVANVCGDGQVTADEACDGMPRRTCEQLGFDFGTSKCSSVCAHDTSECVKFSRCDPVSMRCDPEYPALPPDDAAACVLGSDGLARCWGHSPVGHHLPPRTVFSQVADGPGHACGLGAGGSVSCWGDDSAMQRTPTGGPYVKVVVGDFHSCGLGVDGAVRCWGSDEYRLSEVPTGGPFIDVASGRNHVCALTMAGEAKCWGRRAEAQTFPLTERRFTKLAAAANHACGLTAMGEIFCWGNRTPSATPLTMPTFWSFTDLVVEKQDVCGLAADGRVICAGRNTGDLRPPPDFVPVSLGDSSSGLCALDATGRAFCWGRFEAMEPLVGEFRRVDWGSKFCGVRTDGVPMCGASTVTASQPLAQMLVPDIDTMCALSVDGGATCTMRWMSSGQPRSATAPPVTLSRLAVFRQVACGQRADGTVTCWGNLPASGTGAPSEPLSDFAHNDDTVCGVVAATGALTCWGADPFGIRTPPSGTFTQVRMGPTFACALATDGHVTCWGTDVAPWPTEPDFTALAMSENGGACALRRDAGLECWARTNLSGVPHAAFTRLQTSTVSALGRTVDGGLRDFGVAAPAFEPDSLALVEAPIDTLFAGWRSFCVRSGRDVICLSPEDDATRHLRDVTSDSFSTDAPNRQCWLVDGGFPRCSSGQNPPQVPLAKLLVVGDGVVGLTRDGGHVVNGVGQIAAGPFVDVVGVPSGVPIPDYCVRRASPARWDCGGLQDAGVRGQRPNYEQVSLSRSRDLACGVFADGGAECWGNGTSRAEGQLPAGAWKSVHLGGAHACGLHVDGTVECWGAATSPTGTFSALGVGNDYACAVRAGTRELECWGAYAVNATR